MYDLYGGYVQLMRSLYEGGSPFDYPAVETIEHCQAKGCEYSGPFLVTVSLADGSKRDVNLCEWHYTRYMRKLNEKG